MNQIIMAPLEILNIREVLIFDLELIVFRLFLLFMNIFIFLLLWLKCGQLTYQEIVLYLVDVWINLVNVFKEILHFACPCSHK